jgi:hypothetical protein
MFFIKDTAIKLTNKSQKVVYAIVKMTASLLSNYIL